MYNNSNNENNNKLILKKNLNRLWDYEPWKMHWITYPFTCLPSTDAHADLSWEKLFPSEPCMGKKSHLQGVIKGRLLLSGDMC